MQVGSRSRGMLNREELSDAFDAAQKAQEPIEKQPEPQPFVSRFDADKELRSGKSKLDQMEHISPSFNERVDSKSDIPVEREAEPEPFISRFDADKAMRSGQSKLDQLDHITPGFNYSASDLEISNGNQDQGHGSEMVENEKPSPELKPSPESRDRKDVDRKAHLEEMAKDDKSSKEPNVIDLAEQIAERQAMQSEQNNDLGLER